MYGMYDDDMYKEHMEDVAEESRHKPKLVCDECGCEILIDDIYYDIDGDYYCESCMDRHRRRG